MTRVGSSSSPALARAPGSVPTAPTPRTGRVRGRAGMRPRTCSPPTTSTTAPASGAAGSFATPSPRPPGRPAVALLGRQQLLAVDRQVRRRVEAEADRFAPELVDDDPAVAAVADLDPHPLVLLPCHDEHGGPHRITLTFTDR